MQKYAPNAAVAAATTIRPELRGWLVAITRLFYPAPRAPNEKLP
jgi:hypothetical protein